MKPARARRLRLLVFAALLAVLSVGLSWAAGSFDAMFHEDWWAQQARRWLAWRDEAPLAFVLGFTLLFTLLSALSLPGCGALALAAGTTFGMLAGSLLVGLASTLGATLSFLVARHGLREAVQQRLGHRLPQLDQVIVRHGRWGLFWLRLVPVLPFPVLNPLLGLSQLSLPAFFWPSLAGLTLGSVPYVCAGGALFAGWQDGHPNLWTLAGAALLLAATAWIGRRGLRRANGRAGRGW